MVHTNIKNLLLQAAPFRRFVEMVRSNSHDFEAQGRVLRLKQYINSDIRPAAINAILEALAVNTLVEVLYIQNFEHVRYRPCRVYTAHRPLCNVYLDAGACVSAIKRHRCTLHSCTTFQCHNSTPNQLTVYTGFRAGQRLRVFCTQFL